MSSTIRRGSLNNIYPVYLDFYVWQNPNNLVFIVIATANEEIHLSRANKQDKYWIDSAARDNFKSKLSTYNPYY
jgi:hypothetical protein